MVMVLFKNFVQTATEPTSFLGGNLRFSSTQIFDLRILYKTFMKNMHNGLPKPMKLLYFRTKVNRAYQIVAKTCDKKG